MKKEELQVLGLSDEVIKIIQQIHTRDFTNFKKRLKRFDPSRHAEETRTAIASMLPLIKSQDNLDRILTYVNRAYYAEQREAAQAERDREQSNEEEQK